MVTRPAGSVTLGDIARQTGGELLGDADLVIRQVNTLARANGDEIAFLSNSRYRTQLADSRAGAVILGVADRDATARPRIIAENPYLAFARASTLLNPPKQCPAGVDASAVVAAGARIDPAAHLGAGVAVGDGCVIGARTVLLPGVVVGDGVTIGADCIVYPNVVIYDGCTIGDRVILHANCVIGADGFGMANDQGRWVKIPQIGAVVIGDDVEVGACTTIDRGALDDTVVEEGVKLDNHIQIAHNVRIGAHTAIAGCTAIAGSTRIGRYCTIAGAARIVGHLEIADRVHISAHTLVSRSIREPGAWTGTVPAMPHAEWQQNASAFRHLADMRDRLRALEKKLSEIERNSPNNNK